MSFELLLGSANRRATVRQIGRLVCQHVPAGGLFGPAPLHDWAAGLADGEIPVSLDGHLTGSIDLVLRVRDDAGAARYVVVDYKTNRLGERGRPPRPDDYHPDRLAVAMTEHHYPLQALLYSVALHRYLRWRVPGYDPATSLGGSAYLFLRGMTGAQVATDGGEPHGVFAWRTPPELVTELSDLLDGRARDGSRSMTAAARADADASAASPAAAVAVLPRVPSSVAVLAPFVDAGVFGPAEVHLTASVARLAGERAALSDEVLLALAVAARGPRLGHVCVELDRVQALVVDGDDDAVADLPWPELSEWSAALDASQVVAGPGDADAEPIRPLVWDGRRLYLHRYWAYERAVAADLVDRAGRAPRPAAGADAATRRAKTFGALESLFGAERIPGSDGGPDEPNLQRRAAEVALGSGLAVIVGGPGTGKTRTVARLLAAAKLVADGEGRPLDVALAAPTGKAAARMTEAVHLAVDAAVAEGLVSATLAEELRSTRATTIHSLLGWAPGARFAHDRLDPLPHDLVVVDETSMVALPLMARLLDAVRPDAQLVLVGDPYQLASVEAGTVLGDVVGPTASSGSGPTDTAATGPTTHDAATPASASSATASSAPLAHNLAVLRRAHRFARDSGIARLAEAVRVGDADAAIELLADGGADLRWVRHDDAAGVAQVEHLVVDAGVESVTAALAGFGGAGLEAAGQVKILAATRHQPFGVFDWSDRIEAAVAARVPELDPHPSLVRRPSGDRHRERPAEPSRERRRRTGRQRRGRRGRRHDLRGRPAADPALTPRPGRHLVGDDDPQEPGLRVPARRGVAARG